jgi:hypothetical protein
LPLSVAFLFFIGAIYPIGFKRATERKFRKNNSVFDMKIYNNIDQLIIDIDVDDSSYRHRVIKGENNIVLKYSLPEHVEIPVGSYCQFQGQRYTLERPEAFKKQHNRRFDYTVTFESYQAKASIWKFRNPVDGRLKFSLTATPREHLQMFVDNMNRRDTGWTVGECISGTETLINYDHDFCIDALKRQATTFETEYEIDGKRVSLKKVEYNKNNPLPLAYGCGNGFKSGVGRSNSSEQPPTEILFVQGGTDNINPSKYGNAELLLPKGQTIQFDGEKFEDEDGFVPANARSYIVDDLGLSIRRTDKPLTSLAEDSLDASSIYPKRVGWISSVVPVKPESNFYDFVDKDIPSNLNYEDCLIEGETMTVIFQSGMLAGKEFEVKYYHNSVSGKAARRFEILPQEIDGVTMPNETFKPKQGDSYAVFHCMLPDSYIRDDETKTGGSWDMFRVAVRHLFDAEEQKYSFSGELDGLWAKKDWENIGGRIRLGGYVLFRDANFQQEGVLVRITGIKDYINNPHSPTIELSNQTVGDSVSSELKTLKSKEVTVEDNYRAAVQFTKRRFRDAKETISMLESALLDNFTNSINPIAVQTMSMLVGDKSLQFRFVNNTTSPSAVSDGIEYNNETRQLTAPAGIIQHMTLGIASLSSQHQANEYKFWGVQAYTSSYLDDGSKKYYLYIKANRNTQAAEFILSETARKMESEAGVYYFLVGVLNSEYDGERSFVTLYGYTEVLPGRVTTERVVSGDGDSYFDMLQNRLKLGDALSFNADGTRKLILRGTLVQSESGDTEYIGCYRGVYNPSYTYYQGDEVSYTVNGMTSTYRYIYATPSRGVAPTSSTHWQVIAQGSKGDNGQDGKDGISPNTAFKSTVFLRSNPTPSTPTGGSYANPVPSGWSDGIPSGEEKLWASTRIFSSDGLSPQQSTWTAPRQMTDTADFDVEFSSAENPSAPTGHPNTNAQWSNQSDESTIWMATSKKSNGVWESWQISRIKGENGQDGTSLKVKGTCVAHYATSTAFTEAGSPIGRGETALLDIKDDEAEENQALWYATRSSRLMLGVGYQLTYHKAEIGDAFVMQSDGHLYMADESGWRDVGQFKGDKGDKGTNGLNAYVHIKFANSLTTNDWSANNGETPAAYIGVYTDNQAADRLDWNLYQWTRWRGEDGFGYEYIYRRTSSSAAPSTPTTNSQNDGYVPSGWAADPLDISAANPYCWICYRKKTDGVWGSFIGSSSDHSKAALFAKYGDKGDKGDSGDDGRFTELRFAVNGSTTTPPALTNTSLNPSGWTTTVPTVNKGYYLWLTRAVKTGDGTALISNWSTPVRMTPYDGKDGANGKSPVMVFRGRYDSSKTYYGTETRRDCVKITIDGKEVYYIARIDAGTFSTPAPPDSSKWNSFGASFESIATNLLLAEGANIGDWFISEGRIVSTLLSGNKIILDAKNSQIKVESSTSGGAYSQENLGSIINIDANQGIVEARAKNSSSVAYMSPTGIFANRAGTQCVSATTGATQRASICGLGFGNLNKEAWSMGADFNLIAGVYGNASNNGTAPYYGGYFHNLKANGISLNTKYITSSGTYLTDSISNVVGFGSSRLNVYLPAATREGQTIFVKQWWYGSLRIYPRSGQKIYDDTSQNDYYDFGEGQGGVFTFVKAAINGENVEVWLVSRWKF